MVRRNSVMLGARFKLNLLDYNSDFLVFPKRPFRLILEYLVKVQFPWMISDRIHEDHMPTLDYPPNSYFALFLIHLSCFVLGLIFLSVYSLYTYYKVYRIYTYKSRRNLVPQFAFLKGMSGDLTRGTHEEFTVLPAQ